MKRYLYWTAIPVIVIAVVLLSLHDPDKGLEALRSMEASSARAIPANSIILDAGDAKSVVPPFRLHEDNSAQGAASLELTEGAGTSERTGIAEFDLDVTTSGDYRTWIRARWDDSCGNSISIAVDDGPTRTVGQDSVFNLWHWVKGGKTTLGVGKHKLILGEREDGIAVDQILLTHDLDFVPTGPVSTKTASFGIRRFADDFARSPGHGMEAWDLRAGTWEIVFTLDPNRIPNQYALTGTANDDETAMALVGGMPWEGAILSFNALIDGKGQIGAVVDSPEDIYITVQTDEDRPTLSVTGQGIASKQDLSKHVRLGQWHHFTIERWACVLRVYVDDVLAFAAYDLILYAGVDEPGACIRVGNRSDLPRENAIIFADAKPKQWHDVDVRVANGVLSARIDNGDWKKLPFIKGSGGSIYLDVPRSIAWFDDIEFNVRRTSARSRLYAFDQRETDWWHEGGQWVNHAGIACELASSWISLLAVDGEGILWNKRTMKSDLIVAFNVEESADWYGWDKYPNHTHYPYDNIQTFLTNDEDPDAGYRLEVNSRNHSATVLYRNGVEVAMVDQREPGFPIRFVGAHQPYVPRRNRIALAKQGNLLRAVINGKEVLRYTDSEPLPVSRVGIGGYRTRFNLSHIEICELPADE